MKAEGRGRRREEERREGGGGEEGEVSSTTESPVASGQITGLTVMAG